MDYDDAGFVLACSALLPVAACGIALLSGVRRPQLAAVAVATAVLLALWVVFGGGVVLGPGASVSLGVYYGLLISLTPVLMSAVLPEGGPRAGATAWVAFVSVWAMVVQFAVAGWTLNLVDGWLVASLGLLDFGGAGVLFLSTAAAGLAWLAVHRSRGPIIAVCTPRRAALAIATLWLGFFGITVGAEAVPDSTALDAAVNTLVAPACAVLAWAVVERIRHRRVSLGGAVRGVFAGLVAVTAAADVLSAPWAGVLGLAAGAVAAAVAGPRGSALGLLITQLTAAVLGLGFIGILGEGVGGLLTGSWAQLGAQLFSIGVIGGFSLIVAAALALVVDRAAAQLAWVRGRAVS